MEMTRIAQLSHGCKNAIRRMILHLLNVFSNRDYRIEIMRSVSPVINQFRLLSLIAILAAIKILAPCKN